MPQKMKEYFYQGDSSDLEELMYQVAGWAENWDDMLWYLKTIAPHNRSFTALDVRAMVGYVEQLSRAKRRFTTDYREMYQELTGRECVRCAAPVEGRIQKLPLRKIAEKWLEGLRFSSNPDEAIDRAKANHAPQKILNALRTLAEAEYPNIGVLLQELCERAQARR